jgi:[ribosomal protein S5]-alanine N-acetyltransferase
MSEGIMLQPLHTLTAGNLSLRPLTVDDAPAVFSGWTSSAAVCRFLQWRPHRTIDETRQLLAECVRLATSGEKFFLGIHEASGALAGVVSIRQEEPHRFMVGFLVFGAYQRRGYARQAVTAVIQWCWAAHPACERIWAYCDSENSPSMSVLAAVGMQREGLLRRYAIYPNLSDQARDVVAFAIVRPA